MRFDSYADAAKEVVGECNLCGSKSFSPVAMLDRYELLAPSVMCDSCGLKFLYVRGHYRRLLTQHFGRDFSPHSIEAEQERYAERLCGWLAPFMEKTRGGLLLDLGGSTGVVADRLSTTFNLDATVVEPSQAEADRARSRGLAVANVRLEDYAAGGNHYDLVTLCQTVDHLLDIKAALSSIRQWVAPDGLFFVDFVEGGPTKIDHPFYLQGVTMQKYVGQAGFKVVAMDSSTDGIHVNVICKAA
jgi:SAM-dependent methyltransferase